MRFILLCLLLFTSQLSSEVLVLVHGFMRTPKSMARIEKVFKREGWEVINWGYPSRDAWIQDHIESFVQELQRVASNHPNTPINFMTHSLGGIIVKGSVNHPECPREAMMGKAVLMAPPIRGSLYARKLSNLAFCRFYLGDKAGRQLYETPLDGFAWVGTFPSSMKILVIAGNCGMNPLIPFPNDGKVTVVETRLLTPHVLKEIPAGHSWISISKRAIDMAKEFFKI